MSADAVLSSFVSDRASTSSVITFQDDVRDWGKQGVAGCTIHQVLIRKHGSTGAYSSVRRFIAKMIKEVTPGATVMLDFAPDPCHLFKKQDPKLA
ncbi:hypothetical protein DMR_36610 [Solidesulfovibrio magneticus RS-1]|uniref:Uncharacterized protein n=1 Tax=Solidesulfovibrio magneticus (strain ATCC 700980 / DSM 13731 / RS-1) TaxID=573370 RepID=C4XM24_SOLM1|nr:hypothetical protein DMR_36610 [Solidesulfovibrio magneticus RS-1]